MSYSFTEKKRIRKSFAKRENVLDVPFLLATQIDSYAKFLQLENAFDQRTDDGLQAAFNSIFPIVSHNGYARLEFVHWARAEQSRAVASHFFMFMICAFLIKC